MARISLKSAGDNPIGLSLIAATASKAERAVRQLQNRSRQRIQFGDAFDSIFRFEFHPNHPAS
jgi:hypothetical protein